MEVDETRRHDDAARVDPVRLAGVEPGDRLDATTAHDQVGRTLAVARRVDEPGAAQVEVHRPTDLGARCPAREHRHASAFVPTEVTRDSTAIRIAMPLATWAVTSELGPAATSGAI